MNERRLLQLAAMAVSVVAIPLAIYQAFQRQQHDELEAELTRLQLERMRADLSQLAEKLRPSVERDIRRIVEERASNLEETADVKDVRLGLDAVQESLKTISDQTLGLRQAINPKNPEEILTIARLTDNVASLRSEVADIEERFEKRDTEFRQSVIRELEASSSATNLIIVALIPLVLNLVYSIWKDTRRGSSAGENTA